MMTNDDVWRWATTDDEGNDDPHPYFLAVLLSIHMYFFELECFSELQYFFELQCF